MKRGCGVRNTVLLSVLIVGLGLGLTIRDSFAQIKELKIGIGIDADTLNPQEQTTSLIQNICDLIFDNFLYQTPDGKLEPRLITKYDISKDGLTWTLHLRKGVKFSDGTDFNADAVKLSWDRTLDPKMRVPLRFAVTVVKQCVKVDDYTVQLVTPVPNPVMLEMLANSLFMMNKAWCEKNRATKPQNYTQKEDMITAHQANGTGPYQLDHWTPGAEIVLTANTGYRQGPPKIDRVEIKTIGNFDQRLQLLRARDADLIEAGTPDQLARLDELVREQCDLNGQCAVINFAGLLRRYTGLPSIVRRNVFFNFALPKGNPYAGSGQLDGQGVPLTFFADVHVRRAFNACFDRSRFITDTLAGQGEVPRAITLPDQPGYADSPTLDFDLARCAEEFKAAQFKTKDESTLWDTGFAVQLPYRDGDEVQQAVVDQLAQNIAQINAKFVITPVSISTLDWLRELRAGQIPLAAIGWQEDIHDPHNWYRPYLLDTYTTQFNLPDDLAAKYRGLIDQGAAAGSNTLIGESGWMVQFDVVPKHVLGYIQVYYKDQPASDLIPWETHKSCYENLMIMDVQLVKPLPK